MKLHLPIKLLIALLVCVAHSQIASGATSSDENSLDIDNNGGTVTTYIKAESNISYSNVDIQEDCTAILLCTNNSLISFAKGGNNMGKIVFGTTSAENTYECNIDLNGTLTQGSSASTTLDNGTLSFGKDAIIKGGTFIINGGEIVDTEGSLDSLTVDAMKLNANAYLSLDISSVDTAADQLIAESVSGDGTLIISELNMINELDDTSKSFIVAGKKLKSYVESSSDVIIYQSVGDKIDYDDFIVSYNSTDGAVHFDYKDLKSSITSSVDQKDYQMTGNEVLTGNLPMGGDSLLIQGGGFIIDATEADVTIGKGQSIELEDLEAWKGDITNNGDLLATVDPNDHLSLDGDILGMGTTSISGEGVVNFGGDVKGDVSLSKDTWLDGSLTVEGTLLLDDELKMTGKNPFIDAGKILSTNGKINITIDDDSLDGLGLAAGEHHEIISLNDPFKGDITIANGETYIADEVGLFEIVTSTDGTSVQIGLLDDSNFWMSTDGIWDKGDDADWLYDVPSADEVASFIGQGTENVELDGDQEVKSIIIDSSNKDYTFTGDDLTVGDIHLVEGGLTIDNKVDAGGVINLSNEASLTVSANGELTTKNFIIKGNNLFTNKAGGLTEVTGDLSADGYQLVNDGELILNNGSVGSITGSGKIVLNGELSMDSDYELANKNYESTGTLNVGSHTISLGDDVQAGGSLIANKIVVGNNAGGDFTQIQTPLIEFESLNSSLSVDSMIPSEGSSLITLDVLDLTPNIATGSYQLIDGDGLSRDIFTFSDDNIKAMQDLIVNKGWDVYLDDLDGNITLVVTDDATDPNGSRFIWDTANDYATSSTLPGIELGPIVNNSDQITDYDILNFVDEVHVTEDQDIDLTQISPAVQDSDGLKISNMTGTIGESLNILGDGDDIVTLFNTESTIAGNDLSVDEASLIVDNTGKATSLSMGELTMTHAELTVKDSADFTIKSLNGDAGSTVSGEFTIDGDAASKTTYSGAYNDAQITIDGGSASFDLSAKGTDSLDLIVKNQANVELSNVERARLGSFDVSQSTLHLGTIGNGEISLEDDSTIKNSTICIVPDDVLTHTPVTVLTGASLDLEKSTIKLGDDSQVADAIDISALSGSGTVNLIQLTDNDNTDDDIDVTVNLASTYDKYFTDAQYVDGMIQATINRNSYGGMGLTLNGKEGLGAMGEILIDLNPQLPGGSNRDKYPDLASVLDSLDQYKTQGNYKASDKLGAAIAGASISALGSSAIADIERQLTSMRRRSDFITVCDRSISDSSEGMRRGAWITAEGAYSTLSNDKTAAGHDYSSWGGSVGYDSYVNAKWRVGGALTAVVGEVSADAADQADGSMTNYYASIYANRVVNRWNHNFVIAVGLLEADLDRSISTLDRTITTSGNTDGFNFAASYQIGYKYHLRDTECSAIFQPFAGVSVVHSSVGGYTETGSDAALIVGHQSSTYVTISAGAQIDGRGGEYFINRTSLLTGRLLLKVDAGDRASDAEMSFVEGNGATHTITGADVGAVGVELGGGVSAPISLHGSIFADAALEFRSSLTEVSATLGYRYNF